jgi:hypothetical protein
VTDPADPTGVKAFIKAMVTRDKATWVADLPDQPRTLLERHLSLLEHQLDDHGPEQIVCAQGEPMCTGCLVLTPWPCDWVLYAAAIWREELEFRPEWRDALNPLAWAEGL